MSNAEGDKGFAAFLIESESFLNPFKVLTLKFTLSVEFSGFLDTHYQADSQRLSKNDTLIWLTFVNGLSI